MNAVKTRRNSIALKGTPQARVFDTFEDWQAEQQADVRTPEQRGIHVGATVLWRYRVNQVIHTERATVVAVEGLNLTLQVKDVETRTCSAQVHEIVDSAFGHRPITEAGWRPFVASQIDSTVETIVGTANDETAGARPWQ